MATMSTVWDRTAEFLSDNLTALAPIVLFAVFVPLCVVGNVVPLTNTAAGVQNVVMGTIVLALSLVSNWGALAITALAIDPAAGRRDAVRTANRRFVPVIGISVLLLLGTAVLALPSLIALGLSGVDMAAMQSGRVAGDVANPGALLFASAYVVLLGPILLVLFARLLLINPIMILERRGLGVFTRSVTLTRGIAWKVIGVVLLYLIVSQVAALAARTVFGTVLALLLGGGGPGSVAFVLTAIAVSAISTLFSVLAAAFIAKLYLAARDAREAIVEAA